MTDETQAEATAEADESGTAEVRAPFSSLLDPARLDLPADPDSPEFSAALQQLRAQYSERSAYNFMVADQLAKRGVAPNGMNVRLAGKWGNANAVTSDVKAWYAGLAIRLSEEHAKVPEAVRRGANDLIEQMWSLLTQAVQEPATKRLLALEQELAGTIAQLTEERKHAEKLALDVQAIADEAAEKIASSEREISSLTAKANELSEQVTQLRDSISQAALTHQQEMRAQASNYETQMLAERRALQEEVRTAAAETAAANARVQQERNRLDAAMQSHALTIDKFRQDMKEANQRADAAATATARAMEQIDTLKDQLASASIREARQQQEFSVERADLSAQLLAKIHEADTASRENEIANARVAELLATVRKLEDQIASNSKPT
jgi:chromosome segregation ATPase